MAKKDKRKPLRKADIKLPKDLRRTAKTVIALAQSPIAREIAAAALTAGVAALAKRGSGKPLETERKGKPADIGEIVAQGLVTLLSGLAKPRDPPSSADKPADSNGHDGDHTKRAR